MCTWIPSCVLDLVIRYFWYSVFLVPLFLYSPNCVDDVLLCCNKPLHTCTHNVVFFELGESNNPGVIVQPRGNCSDD